MITRQEIIDGDKEIPVLSVRDWFVDVWWEPQDTKFWDILAWRWLLRPFFIVLIKLNIWEVKEGGRYLQDGRFKR